MIADDGEEHRERAGPREFARDARADDLDAADNRSPRSPSAARTFATAACWASSPPCCVAMRISTVVVVADALDLDLAEAELVRASRGSRPMSAGAWWRCTSITVPPEVDADIHADGEEQDEGQRRSGRAKIGVRYAPIFMNGRLVSSGTRRSGFMAASRLRAERLRDGASRTQIDDDQPRDQVGGEQRGDDADRERDGEAADRAGAEPEQRDRRRSARSDCASMMVAERAAEAGVDRGDGRSSGPRFLAHALVDQHVGVDRHADGQHDAGDAGQRQRRAERRSGCRSIRTMLTISAMSAKTPRMP